MEISKFRKEDYNKPLSKASLDDNKKLPLIDDDTRAACKLDDLTKRICEELRDAQPLAGCDAYLLANGTHWFMEFKYQKSKNVDRKQIWRKACDSISTVRMAIDQTITLDDLCRNAEFFVVFQDEEEKGLDAFKQKMAGYAKKEYPVYWELRKIEGKLYREVHTIPKSEFVATWIPRIWGA
ncbi:MAG: hypothetical protein IJR54_01840 [Oscillibacter sp.]|nr:hypothetical protein [Oscillibacter sp.]